MSDAMDDKYLQLGRLIAAQCTPGFREARLEGALDTDRPRFRLSWTAQVTKLALPSLKTWTEAALKEPPVKRYM